MPVHIGDSKIAALEAVGQLLVIEAEEMQDRRVQIMHVNGIFLDAPADFVGPA